jgi:hypothetical protein
MFQGWIDDSDKDVVGTPLLHAPQNERQFTKARIDENVATE